MWSTGEEVEAVGPPHPAEAGIDVLDEDVLLDLPQRATGVTVDADVLARPGRPVSWPRA